MNFPLASRHCFAEAAPPPRPLRMMQVIAVAKNRDIDAPFNGASLLARCLARSDIPGSDDTSHPLQPTRGGRCNAKIHAESVAARTGRRSARDRAISIEHALAQDAAASWWPRIKQARLGLNADLSDTLASCRRLCSLISRLFGRAMGSLYAQAVAVSRSKPRFMRESGLTSRRYNAVKFTLDGLEAPRNGLVRSAAAYEGSRREGATLAVALCPKYRSTLHTASSFKHWKLFGKGFGKTFREANPCATIEILHVVHQFAHDEGAESAQRFQRRSQRTLRPMIEPMPGVLHFRNQRVRLRLQFRCRQAVAPKSRRFAQTRREYDEPRRRLDASADTLCGKTPERPYVEPTRFLALVNDAERRQNLSISKNHRLKPRLRQR